MKTVRTCLNDCEAYVDGVDLEEGGEIDLETNGLDAEELVESFEGDEPTGDLEERSQQEVGEPV